MSVRRFLPLWGSEAVLAAFLLLAEDDPRPLSFVLLGGNGSEPYVRAARERVARTPFAGRFRFFDGDLPFVECARLMSASDVFVSLMRLGDMRSASVLQAASAGAAPVLADHPEYREMGKLGFRARFVDRDDPAEIAAAVRSYLDDSELWRNTHESNQRYLADHEDFDKQMEQLLFAINELCERLRQ